MRFSRDKRGYENTFVVHQDRRRGKGSRLLYWFRTPPGVKVGRAALDEDAIRLLEELHPDVEFDWTRMLKAEPPPQEARPPQPPQRRQGPGQRPPQPRRERDVERRASPRPAVEPIPEPVQTITEPDELIAERGQSEETAPEPPPGEDVIDFAAAVPDQVDEAPSLMPSAAQARLGTEGIVRLRGRYAEVLMRIDERIADPVRRDELKLQAERLNPDSWVTDDEVRAGLEQYEAAFESLRAVVGRRRKRRRRRGARPQGEPAVKGAEAQDADEPPDSEEPEDL